MHIKLLIVLTLGGLVLAGPAAAKLTVGQEVCLRTPADMSKWTAGKVTAIAPGQITVVQGNSTTTVPEIMKGAVLVRPFDGCGGTAAAPMPKPAAVATYAPPPPPSPVIPIQRAGGDEAPSGGCPFQMSSWAKIKATGVTAKIQGMRGDGTNCAYSVAGKYYAASSLQAASTPTFSDADVERDSLRRHNAVRAANGLNPLQWDAGLAAQAKGWAQKIAPGCGRHAMHLIGGRVGAVMTMAENLAGGDGPQAFQGWANEEAEHRKVISEGKQCSSGSIGMQRYYRCGHWANLINPQIDRLGCGFVNGCLTCQYGRKM